jgi:hypothetical protein
MMKLLIELLPPWLVAQVTRRFGSCERLRLNSAKMGIKIVSACECIAAGCDGDGCDCVGSSPKHQPIYESSETAFFVSQDLMKTHGQWPVYAVRMVERYLPMMRISYGESDSDVETIAKAVAIFKVKDDPPAVAREASRPTSSNPSANKKKGGRSKTNNNKKNRNR